jgi:hypothetical protein
MFKYKSTEEEEALVYPGKVLVLYEDLDGAFKALIHSTDYKTPNKGSIWRFLTCDPLLPSL